MQVHWNHDQAYYRCRLASEYALAAEVDHPKTVYLRESEVLGELDRWLAGLFDPDAIDDTCRQLADAQGPAIEDLAAVEAARRKVVDCDSRLAKHRAAVETGDDPVVVTGWIQEVQGERPVAERTLASGQPSGDVLSPADLPQLIGRLATSRAGLVEVEAIPAAACAYERVGGGI